MTYKLETNTEDTNIPKYVHRLTREYIYHPTNGSFFTRGIWICSYVYKWELII